MTAQFIELAFLAAIILHVLAGIVTVAFVIPLQIKQAGVKNGLRKLRLQLLTKGFLALAIIIVSIFSLTARWVLDDGATLRFAIVVFVMTHAVGVFGKAIIDYLIYHQQYSQKSKDMHTRIDKLEQGDIAREKRLDISQKKV